jgi:polyribonucleotide nucleotidyltransferase
MNINPEKIGDLIGPKGKTIRGIQEETGAEITVDDTGLVTIAAVGGEAMERARQMIQALTAEPVIGETYEGNVKSTTAFGAFVEIMPGTEGLVHISELKHGRTEKTEDVVKKGDRVKVKLLDRDERGRLRLSMKALTPKPEGEAGGGRREEGSSEAPALAAVGAETGSEAGEGEESGERSEGGDRGERPRRGRGGRGRNGGGGGRSRE